MNNTIKRPVLINAMRFHEMHPETFDWPGYNKIHQYYKSWNKPMMQVCCLSERFWLKDIELLDNDFSLLTGVIDNDLVSIDFLKCGDRIVFQRENVYKLYMDRK